MHILEQIKAKIWNNDRFFNLYHTEYRWWRPKNNEFRHYHFGKKYLEYIYSQEKIESPTPPWFDWLCFSHTRINATSMEVIIRGLNKSPVKKLALHPALINDEAMQLLSAFIGGNVKLEEFKLGDFSHSYQNIFDTTISDTNIQTLITGLVQNHTIKRLVIERVKLSEAGWSFIATLLKNSGNIDEIVINYCHISNSVLSQLTTAIINRKLKLLDLSDCNLNCAQTLIIAQYLAEGAAIESVVLQSNKIENEGLKALATALASNPIKLKKLNISNNHGPDGRRLADLARYSNFGSGLEAIFSSLKQNTTLKELFVSGMRVENIMDLAAIAITHNTTLRLLDLSYINIFRIDSGNMAIEANDNRLNRLAAALAVNKTLATLNIQGNAIGAAELTTLSLYMGQFSIKNLMLSTKFQNVSDNHIAIRAFSNGLRVNNSFESLDLQDMHFYHTVNQQTNTVHSNFLTVKDALVLHPTLRTLDLSYNNICGFAISEMLLHPKCKIRHLIYKECDEVVFNNLFSKFYEHPKEIKLFSFDIGRRITQDRENAAKACTLVNEDRKVFLPGLYAFLICNKRGWRINKVADKKNQRKPEIISLDTNVTNKIAEFVGLPLKLLSKSYTEF